MSDRFVHILGDLIGVFLAEDRESSALVPANLVELHLSLNILGNNVLVAKCAGRARGVLILVWHFIDGVSVLLLLIILYAPVVLADISSDTGTQVIL